MHNHGTCIVEWKVREFAMHLSGHMSREYFYCCLDVLDEVTATRSSKRKLV